MKSQTQAEKVASEVTIAFPTESKQIQGTEIAPCFITWIKQRRRDRDGLCLQLPLSGNM